MKNHQHFSWHCGAKLREREGKGSCARWCLMNGDGVSRDSAAVTLFRHSIDAERKRSRNGRGRGDGEDKGEF